MPVAFPVAGSDCIGTAAQENETYQPSASRPIVTVLGVPASGRDQRTAPLPILDSTRKPLSSRAQPCAAVRSRAQPCAAVRAHLRIGERVIPVASAEAGVARRLARLPATKEGLEGAVDPLHHVLQDRAVDLSVVGHVGLDLRKLGLPLVVADGDPHFRQASRRSALRGVPRFAAL